MHVILNGSAGAGVSRKACELFERAGVKCRVDVATSGHELNEFAKRAADGEHDLIVAGGGDGTINAVANEVIRARKILGVLPLGTLNHFAKDLKLPLKLEAAIRVVFDGHPAHVDVGEVNGRFFLNNSSIGLYPDIVRRRDKEQQSFNRGKWAALARAALAVTHRCHFERVMVHSASLKLFRTTPFVFVGNNQYNLDGFGIGGRQSLTCGELCLWIGRPTTPAGLLRLGLRALIGSLRGARDFDAFSGESFELVSTKQRIHVALDGEAFVMETPLRYRTRPGALRVMLPSSESQ